MLEKGIGFYNERECKVWYEENLAGWWQYFVEGDKIDVKEMGLLGLMKEINGSIWKCLNDEVASECKKKWQ